MSVVLGVFKLPAIMIVQLEIIDLKDRCTVEPAVYYGHLGTNHKCPDHQGVLIFQVSLYDKAASFGTITKCVDYAGVLILECPD